VDQALDAITVEFADVPGSNQFFFEIGWLAASGVTTGYPDGGFHPLGTVNRDAMAAFLHRFDTFGMGL
jgi:hypothetical protein